MRYWIWIGIFGVLLGLAGAQAGMLITWKDATGKEHYWACEGPLSRMGEAEVYTIIDARQRVIYTVRPKERSYLVITPEAIRASMERMRQNYFRVPLGFQKMVLPGQAGY